MNNLRIVLTGHPRKVSLSCNSLIRQECLKPSAALLSNCTTWSPHSQEALLNSITTFSKSIG